MATKKESILIIGANGQVGSELSIELRAKFGEDSVICTDIQAPKEENGLFEVLNVLDKKALADVVAKHKVKKIYHLAAILSARGEQNPQMAWDINMNGLFNVLELAKEKKTKIFWPSTIAVFGPTSPKQNTPQATVMEPSTVYGISKVAGELWCQYYHQKYGVDVRSVRYPGLIGYKSLPGGGTTDYAVDIFHQAILKGTYECFLNKGTYLPMMYMPDAIRATIDCMEAPAKKIKCRTSYNLSAISFEPEELANAIKKHLPKFSISYNPDFRQQIAESWPQSIDDSAARKDWGWSHQYGLTEMVDDMVLNLKKMLKPSKKK